MTGAALASAAAIVTASPALLPTHDLAVGAPAPLALSTAKYELTAITDITLQGINDAYWFGWGGYITTTNTYYPGVSGIYVSGASGVLYYVVDNAIESFVPGFDLDNYFFEEGFPAVPYVAAGEIFGTSSPIFQAAKAVFYYGVPNLINSFVTSAAELVPSFNIGPVKLGAGYLASLYFYGQTPDYVAPTDTTPGTGFAYSTNGLSAIIAYISTSISDSLAASAASVSAASISSSLTKAVSAASTAVETVVNDVEGAVKSATTGIASSAASKKTAAAAEVSTDSSTSTGSSTSTDGSTATDSSSTDSSSSTSGTASSAKTATSTTPKTTKPATPTNPLAKIGKQISDALGGKKAKSGASSSSDSSSSGSSSSTGGSAK
ncbi:hypothetical protein [Mycolicibacterium sphagni]|uniref:hypothetical protein n=1 Tax=Mycolicibacterium sphagni TaxID=1786 RepID=UPI0021F318D0|nr:hypothetical protein [Mycolicibacterium sphagni]MCV7179513.1 hypothetical protein [Mycolicibacterium sphagni]